jgi:hypothetical protein
MARSTEPSPRDKLRMHGIRTATSLLHTSETLNSGNRSEYDSILIDAKGGSLMPALEASICTNSNLKEIVRWRRFVYLPLYDAQPFRSAKA